MPNPGGGKNAEHHGPAQLVHPSGQLRDCAVHDFQVSFDELVDRNAEEVGKNEQILHVRIGAAVLPVGYGLAGYNNFRCQLVLGACPWTPTAYESDSLVPYAPYSVLRFHKPTGDVS